ncbi:ISAs1 family transposase [Nonomuraea sp. NPDC002799]
MRPRSPPCAVAGWLTCAHREQSASGQEEDRLVQARAGRRRRRHVAVDGKALRGTRHGSETGRARHVLTAITARTMALPAQAEVDGKSNEITAFCPLLRRLDLTDAVVTVDALHTQREHAIFLVQEKNAHYILVVQKNQPTLYRQLKGLLWRKVPIVHREDHHGHGRSERRQLKVLSVAAGLAFPHAAQAIAIIRKTRPHHPGTCISVSMP